MQVTWSSHYGHNVKIMTKVKVRGRSKSEVGLGTHLVVTVGYSTYDHLTSVSFPALWLMGTGAEAGQSKDRGLNVKEDVFNTSCIHTSERRPSLFPQFIL